jgi:hypothetical protein
MIMINVFWKVLSPAICLILFGTLQIHSGLTVSDNPQFEYQSASGQTIGKEAPKRRHKRCSGSRMAVNSMDVKTGLDENSTDSKSRHSPSQGETDKGLKKAGEFDGDLRDLPKTKPADQDRPRREDPPFEPKPAPTPKVKPTSN